MKKTGLLTALAMTFSLGAYAEDLAVGSGGITTQIDENGEMETILKGGFYSHDTEYDGSPLPSFHVEIDSKGDLHYMSGAVIETNPNIYFESNSKMQIIKGELDKRKKNQERKALSVIGGRIDTDDLIGRNTGPIGLSGQVIYDLGYEEVEFEDFKESLSNPYGELGYGLIGTYNHKGKFKILGSVATSKKRHLDRDYKEDKTEAKLELLVDNYSRTGRPLPLYFYVSKNMDYRQEADFGKDGVFENDDMAEYNVGFEMGF